MDMLYSIEQSRNHIHLQKLILNVEYQNKTKLVCMYNDEIHTIKDNIDSKFIDLNTQKEKIEESIILKELL